MPSAALTWIEPGASATLIWHGAAAPQPGGGRLYVVSGPILEQPPASPYFILAAEEEGDFATQLYRGQVTLPELRAFLSRCRVTRGALVDDQQYVATDEELPVLAVLDDWRDRPGPPALPYLDVLDLAVHEGRLEHPERPERHLVLLPHGVRDVRRDQFEQCGHEEKDTPCRPATFSYVRVTTRWYNVRYASRTASGPNRVRTTAAVLSRVRRGVASASLSSAASPSTSPLGTTCTSSPKRSCSSTPPG